MMTMDSVIFEFWYQIILQGWLLMITLVFINKSRLKTPINFFLIEARFDSESLI